MVKYQKLTKTFGNLIKNADFIKKNSRLRDNEMLKTDPLLLETTECLLSNLEEDSLTPEAGKTQKRQKFSKKIQKNCKT